MIEKKILEQIGFVVGPGWDHEVWVYEGQFWVHFDGEFSGCEGSQISGDAEMIEFFKMFLESLEDEVMESARERFH